MESKGARGNRTKARELNALWGVRAQHARYREDGKWYHQLTRFPGALFDANGYILFPTELAYRTSPHIQIKKDIHIQPGGISSIPGYVSMSPRSPAPSSQQSLPLETERQIEGVVENALGGGQGRGLSVADRKAIEEYAVAKALAHFRAEGFTVTNVGSSRPYDLSCKKGSRELKVEVKGTTTRGEQVVLTANETTVDGNRALFVVSAIKIERGIPTGGIVRVIRPWHIQQDRLRAVSYIYTLPSTEVVHSVRLQSDIRHRAENRS